MLDNLKSVSKKKKIRESYLKDDSRYMVVG